MPWLGLPERLPFFKYQGLGNDFLVLDLRELEADLSTAVADLQKLAPSLCDRRRGVGGDGLLLVTPPSDKKEVAGMIVLNADGSRPEMCGNGLRCVAHFLAQPPTATSSWVASQEFWVGTDHGPLHCAVKVGEDRRQALVRVQMGAARFASIEYPAAAPQRSFQSVSMGNPHAVHWVEPQEDPESLARQLGPAIECDAAYPEKSNVEFVLDTPEALVCWVWERGCGITFACGTGACATAAAAVRAGRRAAEQPITVRLPGGELEIRVPRDEQSSIQMTGPSCAVFAGEIRIPLLDSPL